MRYRNPVRRRDLRMIKYSLHKEGLWVSVSHRSLIVSKGNEPLAKISPLGNIMPFQHLTGQLKVDIVWTSLIWIPRELFEKPRRYRKRCQSFEMFKAKRVK